MPEEENGSVREEISPQAVASATDTEAVQEIPKHSAEEKKRRNDVEYNWAEARRTMQDFERKIKEQDQLISRLQKSEASNEEDEVDKLADDDIITKAHAKKLAAKMAREIAHDVIKQREAATVDERLITKFSDYAEVVSKENIELLKQTEPELAKSLYHMPEPYEQGVAAYRLLKKLSPGSQEMSSQEKEKAIKNSQKPVSVNAVTKSSALGNAHLFENGLTPELKTQLWKEMREATKRA